MQATPVLGGQIFANGGDVSVTFLGSDAGYDNLLFLATDPSGVLFEGHVTAVNTTIDLGDFAAGTELIFQLNNQQGNVWSTGDGSRNSDGLAHAIVDTDFATHFSWVGFEDLPGGGDRDYNDLIFGVTSLPGRVQIDGGNGLNVPDTSSTLALTGLALGGLAAVRRRLHR